MAAKSQQRLRELVKRFIADLADSQVVHLSSEILVGPGSFPSQSIVPRWRRNCMNRALAMAGTKRLDPERHWAAVRDKLVIPPADDEMEGEDEEEDVELAEEPCNKVPGEEASRTVVALLLNIHLFGIKAKKKCDQRKGGVLGSASGLATLATRQSSFSLVAGGDSRTAWAEELEERETEVAEESVPLWAEAMFDRLDQLVTENNSLRTEAAVAQAESRWRDRTFSQDRNTNEYSLLVAVARRLERARRASSPQAVAREIEEALALLEARVVTLELADSDGWVVASAFAEEVQSQDAGLRMKFSEQIRRARAAATWKPKKASTGRASRLQQPFLRLLLPLFRRETVRLRERGRAKGSQPATFVASSATFLLSAPLAFSSRGEVVGVVLPAGHPLPPAERKILRTTRVPVAKWRREGKVASVYVDDFVVAEETDPKLGPVIVDVRRDIDRLGLVPSDKSEWKPTQRGIVLGMGIDTVLGNALFLQTRESGSLEVQNDCCACRGSRVEGPWYDVIGAERPTWAWDLEVLLSDLAVSHLERIILNFDKYNGCPCGDLRGSLGTVGGAWSAKHLGKHINVLEVIAARKVLKACRDLVEGHTVRIQVDGQVARPYIERGAGRVPVLRQEARKLWLLTFDLKVVIHEAVWVPSDEIGWRIL
ncbi:hypothetical protein QOT17_010096 [Balamuthia mandrillaris]